MDKHGIVVANSMPLTGLSQIQYSVRPSLILVPQSVEAVIKLRDV